jgi:hypothetical protein
MMMKAEWSGTWKDQRVTEGSSAITYW